MARSRRRDLWDQTSALRADLHNMFRKEGGRAIHPDELNPLRDYERPPRDGKRIVKSMISMFTGL